MVTAHSTYRAPEQWAHSTGIAFEAVDSTQTLDYAQKIAKTIGPYTGQLSFDYVDHGGHADSGGHPDQSGSTNEPGELSIIECNPRSTNGSILLTAQELSDGLTGKGQQPVVATAGQMIELSPAVLLEGFQEPLKHLPTELHDLVHGKNLGAGWHDPTAMLWAPASLIHGLKLARGHHEKALAAMGGDIVWDGQPIQGMPASAAKVLQDLHS